MNLYKIIVEHCAPKDCHKSIACLLFAKDDEAVYEWLKKGYNDLEETFILTGYEYREDETFTLYDDDYNEIGEETFKERMIRLKGLINDEDEEYDDLYYGKTIYGWKLLSYESYDLTKFQKLVNWKIIILA